MYKTLKERCIEAREDCGLGVAKAAKKLGIKQPSLSNIESGETQSLKSTTATAMVRVYGVRLEWLVEGKLPKRHPAGVQVVPLPREPLLTPERRARLKALIEAMKMRPGGLEAFFNVWDAFMWRCEEEFLRKPQQEQLPKPRARRAGPEIPGQRSAKR